MALIGVVCEYNPFHNGHEYHLRRSRELCGDAGVICVMSGDFVQRGAPAIVDKFARTKMALKSGADLVLELPVYYSTGSAEYFAQGAVSVLNGLGCVDYLFVGGSS